MSFLLPVLFFLYCLSLPFYQFRITLPISSMSITSLASFFLIGTLLILHIKNDFFSSKERLLWLYGFLFILSFIPSLILFSSHHAVGVFCEWLVLPFILHFLLYKTFIKGRLFFHVAQKMILVSLISCLIIAFYYFFSGHLSYDGRLSAMFASPNHLAMFIAPLLLLILSKKSISALNKLSTISIITAGIIVILLTQSLTTLFALIFVTVLYAMTAHKKNHFSPLFTISATAILMLIFFIGLSLKISHSDLLTQRSSLTSRITIWKCAIHLIQDSPVFGHEIDSFQEHYLSSQKYYPPFQEWAVPTPHNLFLTLLFSGGFFTLTTFLLICTRFFYLMYLQWHNSSTTIYPFIISFILISGLTDTSFWNVGLTHIFWLVLVFGITHLFQNKKPPL